MRCSFVRLVIVGLAAVGFVALLGCTRTTSFVDDDDAGPPVHGVDAGDLVDIGADDDGDGLCNGSEGFYRTDRTDPDTDDDGFPDGVEVLLGGGPIEPLEPNRADVYTLEERHGARLTVMVSHAVRGVGEVFTGGFSSVDARDAQDRTATTFFAGAAALAASPMENVVRIDGERFIQVEGRTLLLFGVDFAYPDALEPSSCVSAFPFYYGVKKPDGVYAGIKRNWLVVVPPGGSVTTSPWCPLAACF